MHPYILQSKYLKWAGMGRIGEGEAGEGGGGVEEGEEVEEEVGRREELHLLQLTQIVLFRFAKRTIQWLMI